MSHRTYDALWQRAQATLEEVTQADTLQHSAKPDKDKRRAQRAVSMLYVKYILAVNRLDQCHDQIVQPQKRILIRRLLDASIGRLLELKHELVNLDLSEFSYMDDVLTDLRVPPPEAEVVVPRYFMRERGADWERRRRETDDILKRLGFLEEEAVVVEMTEAEAVRAIQIHERARQGRLRSQFMKEIRLMKEKGGKGDGAAEKKMADGGKSALKIQTTWRGYNARRIMRQRKLEEMMLIGMLPPLYPPTDARRLAEEVRSARHVTQRRNQEDFEKDMSSAKKDLLQVRGGAIRENLTDEVRTWFGDYYKETGKFPDLPSEESGGSALIFSRQGADSDRSKSSASASSKESRKSLKKTKEKDSKKKNAEEEEEEDDPGFKMLPSNFLPDLLAACAQYAEVWHARDERHNPEQTAEHDMIVAEKTHEIEAELRKVVDSQLRKELETLQAALDRQKGRKAKKSSKKKGRSGRKSKKKKERDLTPDRTLASLYEELVTNGIIRKYQEVRLSEFRGERSYAANELRRQGKDPLPSLGDIRQVMLEYCVLPLGSATVHQQAPLVKSLLIAGPHGSGKNMLVRAVCTEVGAVLFDLTPANIVGKYPGKSGLIMLVHLVAKVSRLVQPSVIYMDGAEKPFMKKVPKTDKSDPKRLKKDLPKLVKNISCDDQVMLLGVSNCPWECDQKTLQQTYGKFLLIPKPDYGSMSSLWKELLFQYSGVNRQFDTAAMTKVSDGFTVGSVLDVVKEVMTCKRVLQLRGQPLTHAELVNSLCKCTPVYKEEEEAFCMWYAKTPIGKRKARHLELEAEARAGGNTQTAKKK